MKKLLIAAGLVGALMMANAVPFSFSNITHRGGTDVAGQLLMDVTPVGTGEVLFTFSNGGPVLSSITEAFWDNGTPARDLASIQGIVNEPGVSFQVVAATRNPLGGNNVVPHFHTSANLLSSSRYPVQPNGVNPGEQVGILFSLIPGMHFVDVLNDLETGGLRVALEVQGINGNRQYSDTFLNSGRVPDASMTAVLLGIALLGLEGLRRRITR